MSVEDVLDFESDTKCVRIFHSTRSFNDVMLSHIRFSGLVGISGGSGGSKSQHSMETQWTIWCETSSPMLALFLLIGYACDSGSYW
jgi:hypothetical protein